MKQIMNALENMQEEELGEILQLIQAKKSTYNKPLEFVQELMKFKFVGVQEKNHFFEMHVRSELLNRYGILHGGLMTAFIDTAMAETAFMIDREVERAFTLNIAVDFIKPGLATERLLANVEVLQNSHSIIVFNTKVYNPNEEVVALAMAHFYKQHKRS